MGFGKLNLTFLKGLRSNAAGRGPIAVDCGASGIKALQLEFTDTPTIAAAAFLPWTDPTTDPAKRLSAQLAALPKFLKSAGMKGSRMVATVPAAQTYCKHLQLQLPEDDPAGASELVAGAIAGQLGCEPHGLCVRHVVVPSAGSASRSEVIGMAVGRGLVKQFMDAARAAGMDLVAIHPEAVALLRGFDSLARRGSDADMVSVYIDLGAATSKVIVAHGTELVFAKVVQLGGQFLDQAIARSRNCSMAEAGDIRRSLLSGSGARTAPAAAPVATPADGVTTALPGLGAAMAAASKAPVRSFARATPAEPGSADSGGIASSTLAAATERRVGAQPAGLQVVTAEVDDLDRSAIGEAVDILTDEIALCLRYHDGLFPAKHVTRAVFVGGESQSVVLCQHMARKLRLSSHVADPLARMGRTDKLTAVGVDITKPQPGWAVPLGLCFCPTDL